MLNDWKAALTADFPSDIEVDIFPKRYQCPQSFELKGKLGDINAIHRIENIDIEAGIGLQGTFRTEAVKTGYKGIGIIYLRNFYALMRDQFAFSIMYGKAGSDRGPYVWPQVGLEIDPDKMTDDEFDQTCYSECGENNLDDAKPYLSKAAFEDMRARIGKMANDPRAIWDVVDCPVVVDTRKDNGARLPQRFMAAHGHYKGLIPLPVLVQKDQTFPSRFMLHDAAPWARMNARAEKAIAYNRQVEAQKCKAA